MMNKYISNGGDGGDNEICSNNNPSMVSFVGLDTNNQKHFGEWETNNISSHHQHHHQPTATNNNHNNVNPNFLNPSSTANNNNNNNIFDNFNNNFLSTTPHSSTLFPTNNFFSSTSSSTSYNNNNNNNSTQFLDNYPSSSTSTNFFLKNKPQVNSTSSSFDGSGLYYNGIHNDYRRIGLNLGHRTYFSSRESTMMLDRLVRRPRGFYLDNQVPRCQAEGCNVELTHAKHYHRRHKVCEFHSKATKVVAGGIEQRFCQQCSRFHVLAEFDESKRSCRKRLADHNRRRRKPHQTSGPYNDSSTSSPAVKPVASENETGNIQMGSSSSRSSSELVAGQDHNNNNQQQDMSLSSSSATLSLMIPKCTTNNHKPVPTTKAADTSSLMTHFISNSCSPPSSGPHDHSPHEHNSSQPFISSVTTSSPNVVSLSSYQNLFFPNVNSDEQHHREEDDQDDELTLQQSAGDQHGASTASEHHEIDHEDLHNLLHLRQAMFDVEFV